MVEHALNMCCLVRTAGREKGYDDAMTKTTLFPLTFAMLLLAACTAPLAITPPVASPSSTKPVSNPTATFPPQAAAPILLPISIYILDDEAGEYASARTVEEVETILANASQIWSQAGIELDVQSVQRLTVPASALEGMGRGEFSDFFRTAGVDFSIPDLALINGSYVQSIGGPNGIAPSGTRTFFVMDEPSVHDERVTAHEIGHILGLHHTLDDRNRLLYPGTNGMSLTEEEGVVARYVAQGLLAGVR